MVRIGKEIWPFLLPGLRLSQDFTMEVTSVDGERGCKMRNASSKYHGFQNVKRPWTSAMPWKGGKSRTRDPGRGAV